jgi:hypothetical protein
MAYGVESMKKSDVFELHKLFVEGRENVEDDERSDRPRPHRTDENVERVHNLVHSSRRLSISAIVMQLNLDKLTVKQILSDYLGAKRVLCKDDPSIIDRTTRTAER